MTTCPGTGFRIRHLTWSLPTEHRQDFQHSSIVQYIHACRASSTTLYSMRLGTELEDLVNTYNYIYLSFASRSQGIPTNIEWLMSPRPLRVAWLAIEILPMYGEVHAQYGVSNVTHKCHGARGRNTPTSYLIPAMFPQSTSIPYLILMIFPESTSIVSKSIIKQDPTSNIDFKRGFNTEVCSISNANTLKLSVIICILHK
jgi:hypothetical protein